MATFWLDPTSGNDSNNGTTKALAVKTWTDVFGLVSDGDTITVVDGTHTLTADETATCNNDVTIQSEGESPLNCVIDGNSTYFITLLLKGDITIKNIQFKALTGDTVSRGGIIYINDIDKTILLQNVWFIENNITNTQECGVVYLSGCGDSTANVFNCVFSNNISPSTNSGDITARDSAVTINAVNTTFIHTVDPGGFSYSAIRGTYQSIVDVLMKNSIIYTDLVSNFNIFSTNATITSESFITNCYHGAGTGNVLLDDFTDGGGNITSDPLLVDPASLVFELQPNSPCIDAGSV